MTKIAILGAGGRMGRMLVRCVAEAEDLTLIGALERADYHRLGADAGRLAGVGETGIHIGSDPAAAAAEADVLVDFSFHTAAPEHAVAAAALGTPLVSGVTGLSEEEEAAIAGAAERIPVVRAPNMSLGMNLLFAMVRRAAQTLDEAYDVEIVETHHRLKKDAPSGTALRLGEQAAAARGQDFEAAAVHGREGMPGERPRGQIGIHAVRGGSVVGEHTVRFLADSEELFLGHRAASREAFATGALHAARWLVGRKPGLYDMQDVLGLRAREAS